MKCIICEEKKHTIKYKLVDGTNITVCQKCNEKLKTLKITPDIKTKWMHIFAILNLFDEKVDY